MIAELHEMHFDVMTIRHSIPSYEGRMDEELVCAEYAASLGWEKLQEQLEIGVAGTWQDTRRTDIPNARIYAGLEERTGKRVSMLSDYDLYRDSCWTKDCVMTREKQKIGGGRLPFFWTADAAVQRGEVFASQKYGITNARGTVEGRRCVT